MWLLRLNSDYPWWVFVFPAVLGFLLIYWMMSGRTARVSFRGPERLLLCLPGLGAMAGDLQSYNLTRMLWLLLQHELPLADALLLAGAACGTPRLERACSGLAREVSQGRATCDSESSSSVGLPPLLRVSLLQTAGQEDRLVLRLQATAGFYRQRFERGLLWLRLLMPAVLLVVIGGGCVLGYSLLGTLAARQSLHPKLFFATKVWINWFLSKEGQELAVAQGYLPAHRDVKPPEGFPGIADVKLIPIDVPAAIKADDANKKAFADLFGG